MKYNVSFLLILASLQFSYSQQSYIPVSETGKFWFYTVYEDEAIQNIDKYRIIYIGKDSIMDNFKYKKLYDFTDFPIELNNLESNLIALIRDDTMEMKTYLLPIDTTKSFCSPTEHVIFDFSLEEGDFVDSCLIDKTTYFLNNHYDYGNIVASYRDIAYVANVEIQSDRKIRKIMQFVADDNFTIIPGAPEFLVEGVGLASIHNGFYIDRFAKLTNYCEGNFFDCDVLTKVNDLNEIEFNIIPNPTSGFIKLELQMNISKVEIYDYYGRSVLSSFEKEINVGQLLSGVYFVKYLGTNNKLYYSKFVKM